jgi:2,5-diketo-D-gluconate reductase B
MGKCSEPLFTSQIEYHAYIRQGKIIAACRKHGLLVICHVPLARRKALSDRVIQEVATGHGKTAAPVALEWLIQQHDIGVAPRALEVSEIEENIDLFDFELSEAEQVRISALHDKNLRIVDP